MEQWALGVNLIQDKLRQGPLGQAYKLCGKLFKKMTGGDSDSKETKGERKQQESKGQSQSNRGPGVLQTRTTTGGEGKDDGDGDGHEERRGKRNLPPDAISVVEQEQEENEDDDEKEDQRMLDHRRFIRNKKFLKQGGVPNTKKGGVPNTKKPLTRGQKLLNESLRINEEKSQAIEKERQEKKDKAIKNMIAGGKNTFDDMYGKEFDNLETASIASSLKTQVSKVESVQSSLNSERKGFSYDKTYEKDDLEDPPEPRLESLGWPRLEGLEPRDTTGYTEESAVKVRKTLYLMDTHCN